jgi:cell division septation protein DedD
VAARRKFSFGNLAFWVCLFGASAGAFGGGFYYTYGATVNVNTKDPGAEEHRIKPVAKPTPMAKAATAKPSPVVEAGLVAMPSTAPTATVAPKAPVASPVLVAERPIAEPLRAVSTPAPRRVVPTPVPQPEIYRVHVGGFGDRETAQKQVEELQGAGINAVVVYDEGKYHAQLGAFTDRTRALSVADEVNIRGYSVTIRH